MLDDTPQTAEVIPEMPLVEIPPVVAPEEKKFEELSAHRGDVQPEKLSEGMAEEAVDTENA